MTVAADIDQKPPITMPSNARPIISTAKLGAKATNRPDRSMSTVSPSNSTRRSIPRVSEAMERLVNTANSPDTEIACPAVPWVR